MGYEAALKKAWEELVFLKAPNNLSVKFLADEYAVELLPRRVFSLSCNIPAHDHLSILILHFLAASLKGLPALSGQWVTFRELSGIQGYYQAYRQRAIEPIIRKYGQEPQAIKSVLARLPGSLTTGADLALVLETFPGVPLLIKLWRADSEFGPEANLYFDANIKDIFCIEDVVVLAQLVARQL